VEEKKIKILVVGDFMWPWYQDSCSDALENLGCSVERFGWFKDFRYWVENKSEPKFHSFFHRIQYRFHFGPIVWKVKRNLLIRSKKFQPDIVWFYNVKLISPDIIKKLKKELSNSIFVQYSNDNPFSKSAKSGIWKNYLNSIPLFDKHFVYRYQNFQDYKNFGSQKIYLLRSYFIPEQDFPVHANEIPEKFKSDVVFAGHFEDDGRIEILESICEAGYKLNLFGGGWNEAYSKLKPGSPLFDFFPISPVTNEEYRYAICGSKVALSLLSTLNNDTYTRRSFQIPAMKTVMLSQHSEDLESLFKPDAEAVFFKNKDDLLEKLKILIDDEEKRNKIAESGYIKVYKSGHDINSRMKSWLKDVLN
jgi:spore maturation protein CgeB